MMHNESGSTPAVLAHENPTFHFYVIDLRFCITITSFILPGSQVAKWVYREICI